MSPAGWSPIPEKGRSLAELTDTFRRLRAADEDPRATFSDRWLNDRGLLLDDGAIEAAKAAYLEFFTKNNSYPPVMEFENDLVRMALELFRAEPDAVGAVTSGGSESLFLAAAAACAAAEAAGKRRDSPREVLMADTGYPSFEKYGRYLGYTVRRVPSDGEFRADPRSIESAITGDTILVLASMPSWSHGICDPVPQLAAIAERRGIWLHVDACVGGFLVPFVRELGRTLPDFDFSVPGVTSISADFHKYGYGGKGVSGIFFRHRRLCSSQPFEFEDWAAGLYRSPVMTGTRAGGAIAAAWAVMHRLGREGYLRRASQILKFRDAIVRYAEASPHLRVLGKPEVATAVALAGVGLDIRAVSARMIAYGWAVRTLQNPDALQLVLGPVTDAFQHRLLEDLDRAVQETRDGVDVQLPPVVYSDEILDLPGSIAARAR
jgi:sphinganine-1-phosphate aldolase